MYYIDGESWENHRNATLTPPAFNPAAINGQNMENGRRETREKGGIGWQAENRMIARLTPPVPFFDKLGCKSFDSRVQDARNKWVDEDVPKTFNRSPVTVPPVLVPARPQIPLVPARGPIPAGVFLICFVCNPVVLDKIDRLFRGDVTIYPIT
jgi:hypothetical protein